MATLYTEQSKNITKTWISMSAFFVLIVAIGFVFARAYGNPNILYIFFAFSLIMNFVSFWYSDKIALKMTGANPAHAQAENMLTSALKLLFAVSEASPDLKANQNFLYLQQELSDTENKIQAARRFYNGNVRDLNISIDSFPNNIIAGVFKFSKKEFFDIPDAGPESKPVEVRF